MGGAQVGNGDGGQPGRQGERELHLAGSETLPPPSVTRDSNLRIPDEPRYPEPSVSGAGQEAVPTDRAVGTVHRALGFISPVPDIDAPGD